MDLQDLEEALDRCYDASQRLFVLPSDAIGSAEITELIVQVMKAGEVRIGGTDGPQPSDQEFLVEGIGSLYGLENVGLEARFYLTEGTQGTPELSLRLLLPEAWAFPTSFPKLAPTLFATLVYAPEPAKSFIFASRSHEEPLTRLPVAAGLNFYGAVRPVGPVFGTIVSILGSFVDVTVLGPIVRGTAAAEAAGPSINLFVNYNATLQRYFPQLVIPVELRLVNEIDATGRFGRSGLLFSASFSLGGPRMTLQTFIYGDEVNVVTVEALFTGIAIPSPADLAKLIGGNGDVTSTLPEQYQTPGTVSISMMRFGIAITTPTVTSVEIMVTALADDGWEIVPGWFTVKNVAALFLVANPLNSSRTFNTIVFGEINVPSQEPILELQAYASYAEDFAVGATLVPDTTFDIVQLIALFLPAALGAPSLVFTELALEVEFVKPKTLYTFHAALTTDWELRLGGTSVLSVQYAAFELDNYSNAGEMGGSFKGAILILGATMEFEYIMPGQFSLNAAIPAFDVDLQQIASDLSGGWDAPPWFPSFTFPETLISLTRRLDNGESTYEFHLDANPSVGVISLDVLRVNGTWGLAAGIRLQGGRISSFPGLSGLSAFDDFLTLDDLVMTVANMDIAGFQLAAPEVLHPRRLLALGLGEPWDRRRVYLPAASQGVKAGVYVEGGLVLEDTGDQRTLRKFLGIGVGVSLHGSLYLGLNPALDSEMKVDFQVMIEDTLDLTCTFGGSLTNGVFKIYLRGTVAVTVQGRPLVFRVELAFVANGGYLSGSMQGTIQFSVIQLSNLGLVVGISAEGIPSLGIAATIDVATFNSSIAVFFDANVPSRSMAAGAVSDITLQDIVDSLVGLVEQPAAELEGVLEQIGVHGTRNFDIAGAVGSALDNQVIPVVADAFAANGISIPADLKQVLLTIDEPDQVWYLTDLTTMTHYQLRRKSAEAIDVSLEAQFYLVPEKTDIGGIQFPDGYRVHGIIEFLILRVQLDIEISIHQGVAADAIVDPIVIYSANLFSLTSFDGRAGPTLSLSTYTQPSQPTPEWRPPHFFLSGRLNVLGLEVAAVLVNISSEGFLFEIRGEYFTGTRFAVLGHFAGLDDFGLEGSAFIGLDRTANLGPLGSITIKTGVEGAVGVSYDGLPHAHFSGAFVFLGHEFTIASFDLDTDGKALADLAETVFWEVVDEVRKFLLSDAQEWFNWVLSGIITGVSDIDAVLSSVFGWIRDSIWGDDDTVVTTVYEILRKSEAGSIDVQWSVDPPPPDLDRAVRTWADAMLNQAVVQAVNVARQTLVPGSADRFTMSLVQSFVYRYEQSQVVRWSIQPQNTLPSIPSMGFPFKDFHRIVDLAEFRLTVQANIDFAEVRDVVVTVYYPNLPQGLNSVQLTSPDQSHLFSCPWDAVVQDVYELRYIVNFRTPGQPAFDSGRLSRSASTIVINPESIGIRRVTFDASNVTWDTDVQRIEISFFYINSPGEAPLDVNFQLAKNQPVHVVESQFKLPVTARYTYTATYFMADGSRKVVPSVVSNAAMQFINNPLQVYIVSVISIGIIDDPRTVRSITLKVTYDSGTTAEPQVSSSFKLDDETPYAELPLHVLDPANTLVEYQGTVFPVVGSPHSIPVTRTNNSSIIVGDVPPWFDVTIDPSVIPWGSGGVVQVNVDVFVVTSMGAQDRAGYIFRPDTPAQHWGFFKPTVLEEYSWVATYFYHDLTAITTSTRAEQSPILTLPARPTA